MIETLSTAALVLGHLVATACAISMLRMHRWRVRFARASTFALAAGCAIFAVFTFIAVDPAYLFSDFRIAYYPAAKAVVQSPAALAAVMDMGVHGFVNLPILAYLFAPESLLRLRDAILVFLTVGIILTLAAWRFLVAIADLRGMDRWLLLLLFAANGPLNYSIKEGNTSHWALFALALGLYLLCQGRALAAGAILGLAAVLKLPLLLFGVYLGLRRDWGAALSFTAVCAAVVALSVRVFGWPFVVHWYDVCVRPFSKEWLAAFNVQSLQSFVLRWSAAPERLNLWTGVLPTSQQRILGYTLVALVYLIALCATALARLWLRGPAPHTHHQRMALEFTIILCLALVSSPLSWSHYYAWLLVPTALFLGPNSPFVGTQICRAVGWTAILLATPLVRPFQFLDPLLRRDYADMAISHLMFAALLWLGLAAWSLIAWNSATLGARSLELATAPLGVEPPYPAAQNDTGARVISQHDRQAPTEGRFVHHDV